MGTKVWSWLRAPICAALCLTLGGGGPLYADTEETEEGLQGSFRRPIQHCMMVLGLFKSHFPLMRRYKRLFHAFNVPTLGRPGKEGVRVEAQTFSKITPENIETLFAHQYEEGHPERLGAKGLIYYTPEGKMKVLLWPTGNGRVGNNIHHKDAVASIIGLEAQELNKVVREFEKKGEIIEAIRAMELAAELRRMAENLHWDRRQSSYSAEMLHRFQGFQLTAERDKNGKVAVTKIQISSSVTATQIHRREPLLAEELNKGMALVRDAIPPELRKYDRVEIEGLSRMEIDHPEALGIPGERPPIQVPKK